MKKIIISISIVLITLQKVDAQTAQQHELFALLKQYTVSIGYPDSVVVDPVKGRKELRFVLVGSGLVTYVKSTKNLIPAIVTAKHVISEFINRKKTHFYIRFSWADTILTSSYFGMPVPLIIASSTNSYIFHSDSNIDLGCIILTNSDAVANDYYKKLGGGVLGYGYTLMNNPLLGEEVLIYGYPGHIETYTNQAAYNICTFKKGIVAWTAKNKTNTFLDNILMVESNASYGNSGGPVISLKNYSLIGILVGGTSEIAELKLNGQTLVDNQKRPYYIENRSGVSTVIKAESVKDLLDQVNKLLQKN
jgi:hypothetical protein